MSACRWHSSPAVPAVHIKRRKWYHEDYPSTKEIYPTTESGCCKLTCTRLHYESRGTGPPLILLHGLAGSNRWWRHNIEIFSERHRVIALDLPGYGGMTGYAHRFAVASATDWLLDAIDSFYSNGERVSLIGHSTGGLICAMFAAVNPGRTNKLILAAPSINMPRQTIPSNLWPLAKACVSTPPSFWPTLTVDAFRAGPGLLIRTAQQLFAIDGLRHAAAIEAPTLLIWGERDPLVPVSQAPSIQAIIPGSELRIIPRAGHVAMWDAPEQFNAIVTEFLSR